MEQEGGVRKKVLTERKRVTMATKSFCREGTSTALVKGKRTTYNTVKEACFGEISSYLSRVDYMAMWKTTQSVHNYWKYEKVGIPTICTQCINLCKDRMMLLEK